MAIADNNIDIISQVASRHPHRILFVCLGNICRSPAAEGIMKDIVSEQGNPADWIIDSAGTGGWHVGDLPDRRMRIAARHRGIELDHHCRQVSTLDFDRFDLIVGMDGANVTDLRQLSPTLEDDAKIVAMSQFFDPATRERFYSVPDPYYEGAQGFETVLDLLQESCQNLFNQITNA